MGAFLKRVVLKNYKSISSCDVPLSALQFLVGPNGSGKSNYLDALQFTAEALRTSLRYAIQSRGGVNDVRRRSSGHPTHFGVRLEFARDGIKGHYAFEIGAQKDAGYVVKREECLVETPSTRHRFDVRHGEVATISFDHAPAAFKDRLYLVNASGLPGFREVYEWLGNMGFYNINPEAIREPQDPDSGDLLNRDGSNVASCIARMARQQPAAKERIIEYLSRIVPGVTSLNAKQLGPKITLEFRQDVAGSKHPWSFYAANMSDGTLRALGVLAALLQGEVGASATVIGIEEPEAALHPAAVGVLLDSLREASESVQVLVTSHSPDLLDSPKIKESEVLAVVAHENRTSIGGIDQASREALRQGLYTPGELLRLNQLAPAPKLFGRGKSARSLNDSQLSLFGK